jgi:hypothetical protein
LDTLASGGAAVFELQALGIVALRLWKAIRRLRLIELQRSMVHPQGARCVFPAALQIATGPKHLAKMSV